MVLATSTNSWVFLNCQPQTAEVFLNRQLRLTQALLLYVWEYMSEIIVWDYTFGIICLRLYVWDYMLEIAAGNTLCLQKWKKKKKKTGVYIRRNMLVFFAHAYMHNKFENCMRYVHIQYLYSSICRNGVLVRAFDCRFEGLRIDSSLGCNFFFSGIDWRMGQPSLTNGRRGSL